jgi:protein-disulfide isomerase
MKTLGTLLLLIAFSAVAEVRNPGEVLARIDGTPVTRADLAASLPTDVRAEYERRFEQLEDVKTRAIRDLIGSRTISRLATEEHLTEQQVIDREFDRSRDEIAQSFRSELAGQEEEIYNAERVFLQRLIDDRRIARVAEEKHQTVEQLESDLAASVQAPTADEVQFMINYELARRRASGETPEKQVANAIRNARIDQKKRQLVDGAKKPPRVEMLVHPPRMKVSADDDPRRGPASAPVQIVMFSDFECQYCAQAEPVLARVREAYGEKVAITFRDFPLPIHPMASIAAKAANCSAPMGKYWEFHDALFANQSSLSREKIVAIADSLGLDRAKLAACFDAPDTVAEIEHDLEDGRRYGVESTPSFFVNGRMLAGSQTFERLSSTIDEELALRASATTRP